MTALPSPHSQGALVRLPSPRLGEGLVTHISRSSIDVDLAMSQWQEYVAALEAAGWTPIHVPPAPDCPDSAFVEDTVVMFGDLAVLARPGADERKPEVDGTALVVAELGVDVITIASPGTLDGGDILKHNNHVWVGLGGRTNQAALTQLAELLAPRGYHVEGVGLTRVLHLKSAVTALPDGTVIGYPPLVDDPTVWPHFLAVPEEAGAHVVVLDEETVLMSRNAPLTAQLLVDRGLEVVTVDIGEFEKLEGCVTCLSVRLRG